MNESNITETQLPGVGKRFEMPLKGGGSTVVVIHNSGRRELFYRESEDADGELLLDITDQESRILGTILEGAYFQPVASESLKTTLAGELIIEWYTLQPDSPYVGKTLQEAEIRRETGVTVVTVERGEEVTPNPEPTFRLEAGDTIVTIGDRDAQNALEAALLDEESSTPR